MVRILSIIRSITKKTMYSSSWIHSDIKKIIKFFFFEKYQISWNFSNFSKCRSCPKIKCSHSQQHALLLVLLPSAYGWLSFLSPSMVFMQFWGKKSVGREFNFMKNSCLMHISDISWIIYSQNFSVKYSIKELKLRK